MVEITGGMFRDDGLCQFRLEGTFAADGGDEEGVVRREEIAYRADDEDVFARIQDHFGGQIDACRCIAAFAAIHCVVELES